MGRFADDTAVTRLDDTTFTAEVAPGYGVIEGAPNGGYLMVLGARAMAATVERPDPVTVTAHFLRPPSEAPVTITTEVVRPGGRHATASASVVQDGVECVRLLGTFGDLSRADGITDVRLQAPDWPAPDQVPSLLETAEASPEESLEVQRRDEVSFEEQRRDEVSFEEQRRDEVSFEPPPIFLRLEHRVDPDIWGWADGRPTGDGRMSSWCRLPDDEPMDTMGLLFVADALPPAVFNLGADVGWVPTIELTVHVRRRPPAGWLAARFWTQAVTEGYLEEDGEIWSASGDLLAISRQSALAARPR